MTIKKEAMDLKEEKWDEKFKGWKEKGRMVELYYNLKKMHMEKIWNQFSRQLFRLVKCSGSF